MATESDLRELLCEIGRRIWLREFVAANDGNFSVRLSPTEILCTPTLVSKGFMKPQDLAVVSPDDGRLIRGTMRPTSEIKLHLEIYRRRPDVQSVIHAHPPHATAFATAQHAIPKCVLPEAEVFLSEIPIAEYATPGTQEFAETLSPFIQTCDAFLLASHGAITAGGDPMQAYFRMESLDLYCRILLLALPLGGWQQISPSKTRELLDIRRKLGLNDTRSALPDSQICATGVPGERGMITDDQQRQLVERIVRQVMERLQGS